MARKKKRGASNPARSFTKLSLELTVARLEMARGHDGLLRGEPEPVILVGAYATDGVAIRALGRALVRFAPRGTYPLVVTPEGAHKIVAPLFRDPSAPRAQRVVVLAIALEEDGGDDVARIYGALERPATFSCWPRDEGVPSPLGLAEAAEWTDPVTRAYVLEDGRDLGTVCTSDELIGATIVTTLVEGARHEYRLPFSSQRNDWVATLQTSL